MIGKLRNDYANKNENSQKTTLLKQPKLGTVGVHRKQNSEA